MTKRIQPESTGKAGSKLATISNMGTLDDGNAVAFTIETEDGNRLALHCLLPELGDIFCALATLAKAAGEERNAPTPEPPATHNYLAPIPAQGIGFQAGRTPDETLLVVRLYGFDMAFSVPSSGLVRLADDVARIARTLSAGSNQPQ
jgi:hypothetical protein